MCKADNIGEVQRKTTEEIHQTNAHLAGSSKSRLQAALDDERAKRHRDLREQAMFSVERVSADVIEWI